VQYEIQVGDEVLAITQAGLAAAIKRHRIQPGPLTIVTVSGAREPGRLAWGPLFNTDGLVGGVYVVMSQHGTFSGVFAVD
jgi:hypothetical protein